ncbi:MAG: hypothetical protein II117_00975 [Clostridia bacterium]|nr:hypothetical protein [Clostridia bacterium]
MAIIRNRNGGFFSAVDSRVIRQRMLSLRALGLLTIMLDRPETWQFRLSELTRSLGLSTDEAADLLAELTRKGFAKERRDKYGVYYDIYSFPERPPDSPPQAETAPAITPPQAETAQAITPPQAETAPAITPPQAETAPAITPPRAETAPAITPPQVGMTDEQRAFWMAYIQKTFPPTKNYKSPYRD